MKLARVHPLSFGRIGSRYGRLIDRDFLLGHDPFDDNWVTTQKTTPPVNIKQEPDFYELELPLPGYRLDEINIEVVNQVLTVKGEREIDEDGHSAYILKEHDIDSFERSFELGPATDEDKITAEFKNGILKIRLPHVSSLPPEGEAKSIPIS
jgi:HSP20 family protein